MKKIISLTLLIVGFYCQFALSSANSLKIFVTDSTPISNDVETSHSLTIRVFNLDDLERAESKLTNIVRSRIPDDLKPGQVQTAYQNAFSDLLNSPDWNLINRDLQRSTEPQEMAMRLRIKKAPAFVLNDKYIIYGVNAVDDAIKIYQHRGLLSND